MNASALGNYNRKFAAFACICAMCLEVVPARCRKSLAKMTDIYPLDHVIKSKHYSNVSRPRDIGPGARGFESRDPLFAESASRPKREGEGYSDTTFGTIDNAIGTILLLQRGSLVLGQKSIGVGFSDTLLKILDYKGSTSIAWSVNGERHLLWWLLQHIDQTTVPCLNITILPHNISRWAVQTPPLSLIRSGGHINSLGGATVGGHCVDGHLASWAKVTSQTAARQFEDRMPRVVR
jgi:hypothetical protein